MFVFLKNSQLDNLLAKLTDLYNELKSTDLQCWNWLIDPVCKALDKYSDSVSKISLGGFGSRQTIQS